MTPEELLIALGEIGTIVADKIQLDRVGLSIEDDIAYCAEATRCASEIQQALVVLDYWIKRLSNSKTIISG